MIATGTKPHVKRQRHSTGNSLFLLTAMVVATLAMASRVGAAPPRVLQTGLTSETFQAEFKKRVAKRFAPLDFSAHYGLRGKIVIAVIWQKRETGRFEMKAGLDRDRMEKEINRSANQGFRLEHLTALGSGGVARYSAIWSQKPGQQLAVRYEFPAQEMLKLHKQFTTKKYSIHRIMTTDDAGKTGFTAVWEKADGDRRELQLGISVGFFQRQIRERPKKGFRLRQAFCYIERRRPRIACIWEKRDGPKQEIRSSLTEIALKKIHAQMTKNGLVPAMIAGYPVNGRDRYLAVWEQNKK